MCYYIVECNRKTVLMSANHHFYWVRVAAIALAHGVAITDAHIYKDIVHIICLTSHRLLSGHLFIDQRAQLAQQIRTKEGSVSADRHHQIGLVDICPLERQRTQTSVGTQIRNAISTPVVANSKEFEALALQRMERVCDSENSCAETSTICNARFSPKAALNLVSGT
jgi:hypothetical protein